MRLPTSTTRRVRVLGYGALALLAYVPVLMTARGRVAADTKQFLYLDPAKLMSRAVSMWDPNTSLGTVTHQTIGYLFPMGPYYWVMETLGLPDWVAQRIWLGSILFAAGAGMLFLARTFAFRGPGAVVAALVFMLSPYSLHYSARISVILLPWAALPWLVALVARGMRRGGWRHAAIFALVVQVVGGVNATALVFAGIAPALFVIFAVWVTREVRFRRALATVARFGLLTVTASLWWMSGLWVQGNYGIDILRYTETIRTVATTSIAPEVLRGLGYWFFYGRDKLGPWIEANVVYTQVTSRILLSYAIPVLALLLAGFTRWRYRSYAVVLVLVGTGIAVGVYPFDDPSPFGGLLKDFADSSQAGLALRSTGRAVPLVVLGLALLIGTGVNALWEWFRSRELDRMAVASVGIVVALVVFNLGALWNGNFYGDNLQRSEEIPEYWQEAAVVLDDRPGDTRVLEVPGSDFAAYVWGNTVDPISPYLTDRHFVARELIPYGSAPSADLLNAFDRRLQEGTLDDASIAPVARVMAAGEILLRNDLQFERFNTPRPALLWGRFSPQPPPDIEKVATFGGSLPEREMFFPFLDDIALALPVDTPEGPPVAIFEVTDPRAMVRAQTATRPLLIAGNGDGLVDAAAVGLVDNDAIILYSATFADDPDALRAEIDRDATLVVTDTNRKRGVRWSTVRDNVGYTERADESPWRVDASDARLEVFPGAGWSSFTVAQQRGARVEATAYGNPVSFIPEERPAMALDGDLHTAWKVGAFDEVIGERIRIVTDDPVTTDEVHLVQPLVGPRDRYLTEVTLRFDGADPVTVALDASSRTPDGQTVTFEDRTFRELEIELNATNWGEVVEYVGISPVGFAEITYRDRDADSPVRVDEVLRMPTDLLDVAGASSLDHPLVLVMTRERTPSPPRSQVEQSLQRAFELPTARSFGLTGVARLTYEAPEPVLDELLGYPTLAEGGIRIESSSRLPGDLRSRAASAIDGDLDTAWRTPFLNPQDQWLRIETPQPVTFDHLDLVVMADGRHSVPTRLAISVDGGESVEVDVPPVTDASPGDVAEIRVEVPEMEGSVIAVGLAGLREVTTIDYHSVSPVAAPVGIVELGIPGVELNPDPTGVVDTGCRDDLVEIDGEPVSVRVSGERETALARGELDVAPCTFLDLGEGASTLRAAMGRETGIDLDRIVLTSAPGGAAGVTLGLGTLPAPDTPALSGMFEVTGTSRTGVEALARGIDEPFWFVLGQTYNEGWRLEVNGEDLGEGTLVNGYANGWFVDPDGADELRFEAVWVPQRVVNVALALSGIACILCLGLVLATWRRARLPVGDAPAPELGLAWGDFADFGIGRRIASIVVPGVVAAAFVAPEVGLVVAALCTVVVLWPRTRGVFALLPAALLGLAGLYIAVRQHRNSYPAFFEWPTFFDRVHLVGWLAVLLLASTAWFEILRRRTPDEPETPDPEDPPQPGDHDRGVVAEGERDEGAPGGPTGV